MSNKLVMWTGLQSTVLNHPSCVQVTPKGRVGIILIMGWSRLEAGVCFCLMDQKIRDLESLMFSDLTFLGREMVASLTGHLVRKG